MNAYREFVSVILNNLDADTSVVAERARKTLDSYYYINVRTDRRVLENTILTVKELVKTRVLKTT